MIEEKSISGTEAGKKDYSSDVTATTIGIPRVNQRIVTESYTINIGPNSGYVFSQEVPDGKHWIMTRFRVTAKANVLIGLKVAGYIDGTRAELIDEKGYQDVLVELKAGWDTDDVEITLLNHSDEARDLLYSHVGIEVPKGVVEVMGR